MSTPMQLKMIPCPKCGNDFPEKRKELGYHVCVNCSTEMPKVGRVVMLGDGDHTCVELEVMDQATAARLTELENLQKGQKGKVHVELLDLDADEEDIVQQTKEKVRNVLDEQDAEEEEENQDDESILTQLSKEKPE